MPIRIYALAKELGIENKQLVDICNRAGIKGKGSALASLEDAEVDKIKSFLEGDKKPAPAKPVAPVVAARPVEEKPEPNAPLKREDYVPVRDNKIRDLSKRKRAGQEVAEGAEESSKETPKKEPGKKDSVLNVRLANMPNVKQPDPEVTKDEPKVQKPDIALPKDAIRGAKAGQGSGPLDKFAESTKQKKDKKKGKATPLATGNFADDSKTPLEGRGRARKGRERTPAAGEKVELSNARDARTQKRKKSTGRRGFDDGPMSRRRYHRRKSGVSTAAPRKENVSLQLPCTVRSFSEATGVGSGQLIKALMELGMMVNINAQIDDEVAYALAEQFQVELDFKQQESLEESLISKIEAEVDPEEKLESRPPVVTFLGHVDHGKTSLLDHIIGINVVSGEAGGITQHIRAYQINNDGRKISFVDTPGHEAFTEMRARGANVTDIAVLVVAADDGVMPQTEEAISHAKAAGVPIIVALNKIDLPGADPNKAMQDLASHELLPSEWGGEVEVVKTSAITGEGMDELLETILVTAELHEYKANPRRAAVGTCLEAEQEEGRGVVAKMIVQNGTLHVGDVIVCGSSHGRVKAMYDTLRVTKKVKKAAPTVPVNITGLDIAPDAGDRFYVLDDIAQAREVARRREDQSRQESLSGSSTKVSLEEFQQRLESGNLGEEREVVTLNLILRADVRGSIEAIQKEFEKLEHPEVRVNILQASVGGVTRGDVTLAHASQAVIIGFNVVPDDAARSLADDLQVEIRRYEVIYKITDDIRATLEGRLKPDEQSVEMGSAMVLRTFTVSRVGTIAGCRVMRGNIDRNCRVRVIRENRVIGDYPLDSLKREKDDAKEVRQGMECGIKLAGFNDIKEADQLEAYRIEEVARTL